MVSRRGIRASLLLKNRPERAGGGRVFFFVLKIKSIR